MNYKTKTIIKIYNKNKYTTLYSLFLTLYMFFIFYFVVTSIHWEVLSLLSILSFFLLALLLITSISPLFYLYKIYKLQMKEEEIDLLKEII
jgi:membrane protein YdbS with pleckstrin-like domain